MNAATWTKPAKGLALASGLFFAFGIIANADSGTLPLGTQATTSLASFYLNPPTGPALPKTTVPFDLSGGNFAWLNKGGSVAFTTSYKNPGNVYLLLNTSFTYPQYAGRKAGQVTLTFGDGTSQSTDLTIGGNVREWRVGAGSAVVGTITDTNSSNAWDGFAQGGMGGGQAVLDQLKVIVLAPTSTKVLTGISVTRATDDMDVHLQVSGVTVDYTPVVTPPPAPKPQPQQCSSGKLTAQAEKAFEQAENAAQQARKNAKTAQAKKSAGLALKAAEKAEAAAQAKCDTDKETKDDGDHNNNQNTSDKHQSTNDNHGKHSGRQDT